jgi:hypothetical protein
MLAGKQLSSFPRSNGEVESVLGRSKLTSAKLNMSVIGGNMAETAWLYCTLCERAFQANSKISCNHDRCDGRLGDIYGWEIVRELNNGYPDIPIYGEEYPLFGGNPSKKQEEALKLLRQRCSDNCEHDASWQNEGRLEALAQ